MTLLTKKCFCLAMGLTAVHLVSKSFLGLSGFIAVLEGATLVVFLSGDEFARGWGKYMARILNYWGTFLVKVTSITKTAAIVQLKSFKFHARLSKYHGHLHLRCGNTAPASVSFTLAG
jgi:hypothetical protein